MADTQELRTAPRIHVYSRSSFDDTVEHGLIVDISETGACLTMRKDTPLFKDVDPEQSASSYGCLQLNIFHPDDSFEHGLDINANIAWLDHEYSNDRNSGWSFCGCRSGGAFHAGDGDRRGGL